MSPSVSQASQAYSRASPSPMCAFRIHTPNKVFQTELHEENYPLKPSAIFSADRSFRSVSHEQNSNMLMGMPPNIQQYQEKENIGPAFHTPTSEYGSGVCTPSAASNNNSVWTPSAASSAVYSSPLSSRSHQTIQQTDRAFWSRGKPELSESRCSKQVIAEELSKWNAGATIYCR